VGLSLLWLGGVAIVGESQRPEREAARESYRVAVVEFFESNYELELKSAEVDELTDGNEAQARDSSGHEITVRLDDPESKSPKVLFSEYSNDH
jgi:hypothetical protein